MEFSVSIANYFVRKSFETGKELTPMKLVKLTYIAHGWYLALKDEALLSEAVQAWKYGPVVESVYESFKSYGAQQIFKYAFDTEINNYPMVQTKELRKFLDKIWEVYGNYTGIQLSALTHKKNTPWDITWNVEGGSKMKSAIIKDSLIKEHYKTLVNERDPS